MRFYNTPDGKFPSVTSVLSVISKPALVFWSANVEREMVIAESAKLYHDTIGQPEMPSTFWTTTMQQRLGKERAHTKELEKAGEIGSEIHNAIEWNLKARMCIKSGRPPIISKAAQWGYSKFLEWADTVNLKPLMIEKVVWSKGYSFAGRMDLLAEVAGMECVLDWKSGKRIYPESWLQNVAYRKAAEEMGIAQPKHGYIVRLPKIEGDPDVEAQLVPTDTRKLFAVFLNALVLWQWQQETSTYAEDEALVEVSNRELSDKAPMEAANHEV